MYVELALSMDDAIRVSVYGSGSAELGLGAASLGVSVQLDDDMMRELVDKATAALAEMDRQGADELSA